MAEGENDNDTGIGLPTIGHGLAAVAKSGPGKALLNPAAKVFGEYFGWRAEEITEGWKKKREENIRAHLEKVRKNDDNPIPREPTEKQLILIAEWIEHAQEVDPEDPEISALWESLLGAIYRKQANAKEWLEVIAQLNESDAKALLILPETFRPRNTRELLQAKKFVSLGLLDTFIWSTDGGGDSQLVKISLVLLPALALAVGASVVPDEVLNSLGDRSGSVLLLKPMIIFAAVCYALVGVFMFAREMSRYKMSDFGRAMQQSALSYLAKKPSPAQAEAPAAGRKEATRKRRKTNEKPIG